MFHSIGENAGSDVIDKYCIGISRVGWQKTHATLKIYVEKVKYIINYTLYLAHYDAYFHINDDAKKCRYLSITNKDLYSFIIVIFGDRSRHHDNISFNGQPIEIVDCFKYLGVILPKS